MVYRLSEGDGETVTLPCEETFYIWISKNKIELKVHLYN